MTKLVVFVPDAADEVNHLSLDSVQGSSAHLVQGISCLRVMGLVPVEGNWISLSSSHFALGFQQKHEEKVQIC